MAWIDSHLEKFIIETFPDRKVYAYHECRTWQSSRYLYVTTVLKEDQDLHYEYIGGFFLVHPVSFKHLTLPPSGLVV